ncbi:hypothetical protein [Nocardioides sp. W7]|uniref:hypothetical protein n=1 Tax=Nocardioides sp. W7 TaxID=2931390 RepID=UPI001FD1A583|nr:hypothetical protein [Nocardioides sp. W7]
MAKTTFDIKSTLYAGAGVADLAVAAVREYVADVQKKLADVQKDVQKSVADLDLAPQALRDQALTVVSVRVDALAKDAKARRAAIEARVAELQGEAKVLPTKVQGFVDDNVATATSTYGDLAKRGEVLVTRIRRQEATKATVSSAKTTTAKAKTTRTQTAKATKATAKKTTSTVKKTAAKKATAPKSSANATTTAVKKTATSAVKATTDAAAKVGD